MRFGFLLNEVLTGLRRNVTMTIAMILTTAISIGLFGGGLLVVRLADQSRAIYLDRVESQVFLTNDVSANDPTCDADPCKALRAKIEARDDVKSVRFLNRDDAYNDAIKKFPQYKDVAGKDAFPASFIVKLDNPEQHKDFDDAIAGQPGVLNVLNQKDLIDRLFAVLDGMSNAAFAVALVQAVGAILLIANMVQVAAYTRRTEIGIMRLVGASRWYTQLPFLVEAMLAAFIGVVIAIVGLILVRALFLENALNQFYEANLIAKVDYADISLHRAVDVVPRRGDGRRHRLRHLAPLRAALAVAKKADPTRSTQQPGRRDQSQGAAQLFDPRDVRGRGRADGHRGEEPARRPGLAGRRVRDRRRRRDLAAQPAHPGVSPRQLDQPRAAAQPQAVVAPQPDRHADRQDPRRQPDAGAAVAVLLRRQGQGRTRAGPR